MAVAAAAPATPPLLPVTNSSIPPAPAPAADSSASSPAAPPAFRLFVTRLSEFVGRSLADRRPWAELLDRSAFSRPESLSDAANRIRRNVAYFRVNYAAIAAACLAASLLAHPFSLIILLFLLAAWCFMFLFRPADAGPLVLFGRQFSDRDTFIGLICVTIFTVFLTSVGALIISGVLLGALIVGAHGAFRMPEDLFLDEADTGPGGAAAGLLSFLGGSGAASSAPRI